VSEPQIFKARLIGGPFDGKLHLITVESGDVLPESISKGAYYVYARSEALPEPPADVLYVFEGASDA
jgi:hypothetical protein